MKSAKITALLALASAFGLIVGCGQKEQPAPETPAAVEKAAEAVPAKSPKAPEAPAPSETPKTTEAPAPAVAAAPEAAPTAAAATSEADGLIDKVKSLIADKNYTEATNVLKELGALKLTPEQQKVVDDLKAQIESALQAQATSEATKSVGGMLGK